MKRERYCYFTKKQEELDNKGKEKQISLMFNVDKLLLIKAIDFHSLANRQIPYK